MLSLSPCRISSWDSRQYRAVIFWLDCIMFTSLFSAKPIESCGKFPQPQYTLNRLKSPDDFLRNLTVLHFHYEKVSDTVVNRVLRLNFKAGIDNIVHVPDPIFFALHYFVFWKTVKCPSLQTPESFRIKFIVRLYFYVTFRQNSKFPHHIFESVFICIFHRILSAVRLFGIFTFRQ